MANCLLFKINCLKQYTFIHSWRSHSFFSLCFVLQSYMFINWVAWLVCSVDFLIVYQLKQLKYQFINPCIFKVYFTCGFEYFLIEHLIVKHFLWVIMLGDCAVYLSVFFQDRVLINRIDNLCTLVLTGHWPSGRRYTSDPQLTLAYDEQGLGDNPGYTRISRKGNSTLSGQDGEETEFTVKLLKVRKGLASK